MEPEKKKNSNDKVEGTKRILSHLFLGVVMPVSPKWLGRWQFRLTPEPKANVVISWIYISCRVSSSYSKVNWSSKIGFLNTLATSQFAPKQKSSSLVASNT